MVKPRPTTLVGERLNARGVWRTIVTSATAISLSGLTAATLQLSASASNLANAGDASAVGAAPAYSPVQVDNTAAPGGGVIAQAVSLSPASLIAYDPTSPLASGQGLIDAPAVDPITEITNQLQARQAFAISLSALRVAEQDQKSLLDMTA
jgi:flagellar basal body rod protein FlgC